MTNAGHRTKVWLLLALVTFLWFGSIYLAVRYGIWWPWLLLIGLMLAGAAKDNLENDDYLP